MATEVLYISYDGMTDPLGQSQVIPYLAGLSEKGYAFTLISCEKSEAYEKNKDTIRALMSLYHIDWRPISYTKKPPVLSTVYDVYKIKQLAARLHRDKKFALVHCRSYIAALVGLQMKRKYNTKFVFDMRGFWADERVDGKLWNLKNPLYKTVYDFFKKKEKQFLQTADYTISLTQNAKNEIISWKGKGTEKIKIEVIPCCADLDLFNKATVQDDKVKSLKEELKIEDTDFILLYLGSIGTWYLLDEMMEFFSVLKSKNPASRFLLVTKDEHERILKTAIKFNLENDIILRSASREEIPGLISLSHFSVFFILPAYSKKASSPTKQGEIMAMGIPVVCNTNVGDTDKIINLYSSGILVTEFSIPAYLDAVAKMSSPFDSKRIAEGAREYFSLSGGVEKYDKVYRAVLS